MFPSSFREASPEQRQHGGASMQLYMLLYTCAGKKKSINSPGQQVIPGESSFPLTFPAGVAVLDLGQRDHTSSATSSGISKAGG